MVDGVAIALQLLDLPVRLQFSADSLLGAGGGHTAADANITLLALDEGRGIDLVGLVEGADGDAINQHVCALLERILPGASLLLRVSNKIAEIGLTRLSHIRLIAEALLDGFDLELLLSREAHRGNITLGVVRSHIHLVAEILQVSGRSEVELGVLVKTRISLFEYRVRE